MAETRTVYSFSEFAGAITDMAVDTVILGADITLENGVEIPAAKERLIIDGMHNETIHTFTDMDTIDALKTLGVHHESSIDITIQNMVIEGLCYFGVPYVTVFEDTSGVKVTYRNVTYTGPQIAYNQTGTVIFEDCDITVTQTGISLASEVCEACAIVFSGTENTVRHSDSGDAVFWFRGDNPSFSVKSGTKLILTTTSYFMYSYNNPVTYELEPSSFFEMHTDNGISSTSSHSAASFHVGSAATFRYTQQRTNLFYASLYMGGSFTVDQDAVVYMQADFSSSYALLSFSSGSGALTVNNPKSFVLYKNNHGAVTVSGTHTFTVTAEQFNQWSAAQPFPDAGTFRDEPSYKWYNTDWTPFTVNSTVTAFTTTSTATGLFNPEPELSLLSYQNGHVISAGNIILDINPITDSGRPITGLTEPNANMEIKFTVGGTEHVYDDFTSNPDGSFELDHGLLIPAGTPVSVRVNTPFLIKAIEELTVPEGSIDIVEAPVSIVFEPPPVSLNPVLLRRRNHTAQVEIFDDRAYPTAWRLAATTTGPLSSENGDILENAVVYKDENSDLNDINDTPYIIHSHGAVAGTTTFSWNVDEGILARLTQPIRSGVAYSTKLIWTLDVDEET